MVPCHVFRVSGKVNGAMSCVWDEWKVVGGMSCDYSEWSDKGCHVM